jgi:hypothetical protein
MDLAPATSPLAYTHSTRDKYGRRNEVTERSCRTLAVIVTLPKCARESGVRTHFVNDRTRLAAPTESGMRYHEVVDFPSLAAARAYVADLIAEGREYVPMGFAS